MADWYGNARSNYFEVKDSEKFKNFIENWGAEHITQTTKVLTEKCIDCLNEEANKNCEKYVKRVVDKCKVEYEEKELHGFLGEGQLPHWKEKDGKEFDFDDFVVELSQHLKKGSVAIMMEAGAEKLRYITGFACAVNWKGDIKRISLDDIYDEANKMGKIVTRCEY
jgi:hypothetical protein